MGCDCFFVSDLHGSVARYRKLATAILERKPRGVFLGGDLFPSGTATLFARQSAYEDFFEDILLATFSRLREKLGSEYPDVFVILGNDDSRIEEDAMIEAANTGIWHYAHNRRAPWGDYVVYGYSYVPPTPFLLKDWERYDVSRYVDPGCVSPEEGSRSVPVSEHESAFTTMQKDLQALTGDDELARAIMLFHSPPYQTKLDRAALDGKMVDHVELDPHLGSIAIRRFIESRQPLVTLHGHVHESARLTGAWRDQLGTSHCFTAAHDGPELALVSFDPAALESATRELL